MHNDISFLIDTEMNLFEEQSTYNPNMPLKGFLYFSILYQKYLEENGKNIISEQLIKIPTPRFYAFYHGKQKDDETSDNNPESTWTGEQVQEDGSLKVAFSGNLECTFVGSGAPLVEFT